MTSNPAWLLLIHQIPSTPPYLRVKVGRRLQQIGAVAVKSTVYALPNREGTRESFQWLLKEIASDGGEAVICEAAVVEGMSDEDLRQLFRDARQADYDQIAEAARSALAAARAAGEDAGLGRLPSELGRWRRRLSKVREIDYFDARGRMAAEEALRLVAEAIEPPADAAAKSPRPADLERLRGRTWVTRSDLAEDRIASAWLIRRFIDPEAVFRFEEEPATEPAGDELRFDTYGGEFTHEGDLCTFEVLLLRCGLTDPALQALGEIIHDIDLRDDKFGRPEAAGVKRLIQGIRAVEDNDEGRLERGSLVLDTLLAGLHAPT